MDWIIDTLTDPAAEQYKGWLHNHQVHAPTSRVAILHSNFVVVVRFDLDRRGNLRGHFNTCFPATNRTLAKIRRNPVLDLQDCLNEL